MILSKLCSCFWVPFRFKTWRIAKVNGLTLIFIVFIGGSGIVQIQETENVNRNNQPEGGKGVGREGERILFSLPLAIFHFLSSSLYFGPFSINWTPGTGKITASMILLVIFKTVARGLARKLNPRQTDQRSSIWAHPRRLIFIILYLPIYWAIPHKEDNQPVWTPKKQNKTKTTEDNIKT